MEAIELLEITARGEDGKHQFKQTLVNNESLAAEMVAFSNSGGGQIFVGVNDNGSIAGLTREKIGFLNSLISNTACDLVRPPINPSTENVQLDGGLVMIITIFDGVRKPYIDNKGAMWVKSGADKRKVTSQEEMQRIFQSAGLIHGDEVPANGLSIADVDVDYFHDFFQRQFGKKLEDQELALPKIIENMNLAKDGNLNVAGALLFSKMPQYRLPVFIVKVVAYPGADIHENQYLDSADLDGKLADIFQKALGFINRNLRHVQEKRDVNSTKGILPFRGVGSGILRVLKAYPAIDFIEDKGANFFKAVIRRP